MELCVQIVASIHRYLITGITHLNCKIVSKTFILIHNATDTVYFSAFIIVTDLLAWIVSKTATCWRRNKRRSISAIISCREVLLRWNHANDERVLFVVSRDECRALKFFIIVSVDKASAENKHLMCSFINKRFYFTFRIE